ncbi:MAG: GntR family transcriptional regulator [Bacteroidetes bacterium]|nr:GntR family transcriptional regulator [Bacteroidota bacterium]
MSIKFFNVSNESKAPKYKQIIQSLIDAIEKKELKKGDKLPSINDIRQKCMLSRDTVLVAFNELKARGIIDSVPGKGYYITNVNITSKHKIFLLFDELNAFKENLYNSFLKNLQDDAVVDIYFHHFNKNMFENLITKNAGDYTSYVIMPAKFNNVESVLKILSQKKVYILDQTNPQLKELYPGVFQNFKKDMYDALSSGKNLLAKYKKIILVFPGGKEPEGQKKGFEKFSNDNSNSWNFEIISTLDKRTVSKGEVYIMPNDRDLVELIKIAKKNKLITGKDLGVISYNDTPLKEVVCEGITTISTDFCQMGKSLADIITNKKNIQIENHSMLIRRSSL